MSTAPKTSAAAIEMLDELQTKRLALMKKIDSGADRCRGLAVAAHLGDADAAEELREIETEEAAARGSLRNLDAAIAGIDQMRKALEAKEAATRESHNAAELSEAIDGLLATRLTMRWTTRVCCSQSAMNTRRRTRPPCGVCRARCCTR
jgi:hypothetical protein